MDKLISTLKLANKHMASDTIVTALGLLWANKDNAFCKQAINLLLDKLAIRQGLKLISLDQQEMMRDDVRKGTYAHKMGSNYFQKSDLLKKKIPEWEALEVREKKLKLDFNQRTKELDELIDKQARSVQE